MTREFDYLTRSQIIHLSLHRCIKIQGSIDGSLFPEHVLKQERFKIFRKFFCRPLPVYFHNDEPMFGIDAYHFHLSKNAFHDNLTDPETKCYCDPDGKCLKRGLGNISPCYFGELCERVALKNLKFS
jgi:scavenger receptor class B, member 1